jgi:hypothetical protein
MYDIKIVILTIIVIHNTENQARALLWHSVFTKKKKNYKNYNSSQKLRFYQGIKEIGRKLNSEYFFLINWSKYINWQLRPSY